MERKQNLSQSRNSIVGTEGCQHTGGMLPQPVDSLLQLLKVTLQFYCTNRNLWQISALHISQQLLHGISPQQRCC